MEGTLENKSAALILSGDGMPGRWLLKGEAENVQEFQGRSGCRPEAVLRRWGCLEDISAGMSALFLRHSLLPDSAAAEQQHRGEKQGQYASMHRVSSFQGNQGSLRPLPAGGNAMAHSRRFFKSRVSPHRRRAPAR